ncbi:hypothetical protein SON50_13515 [Staphylococcus aureus]
MEPSKKLREYMISKKDFISPFNHATDLRGFIKDIKSYFRINCVDPKGEAKVFIKSIIRNNGIDDPDLFIRKYIFSEKVYTEKNIWK